LLLSIVLLAAFRALPAADLLLRGAQVYEETVGSWRSPCDVLILGDRIAALGPDLAPRDGVRVLEVPGTWIVPGLIDAHIHFGQSGGLYTRPDGLDLTALRPYAEEQRRLRTGWDATLRRYLRCGITTVQDVGGPMWNLEVRAHAAASPCAPRVLVAGPLLSSWLPPRLICDDPPILRVDDAAAAVAQVERQADAGVDLIKIWWIVHGQGPEPFAGIARAIVAAAHRRHLRVAVHATELATAKAALACGCDLLVHSIEDRDVDDAFVAELVAKRIPLIPTLVVGRDYARAYSGRFAPLPEEARLADPEALGSLYDAWHLPGELVTPGLRARMAAPPLVADDAQQAANLLRLVRAGAVIAVGTDAGNVGTLPGPAIFRELAAMARAGLSPRQILRAASIDAGAALGRPDLGHLAPGAPADLLVLDADPLVDSANLARLRLVIAAGRPFLPREIIADDPAAAAQRVLNALNAGDAAALVALCGSRVSFAGGGEPARDVPQADLAERARAALPWAPRFHWELRARHVEGTTARCEVRVREVRTGAAVAGVLTARLDAEGIGLLAWEAAGP
jgi:imidazolonepropionase-like amidohydrolase